MVCFSYGYMGGFMNTDKDFLERLHEAVPRGGAICLVGAGFSVAATDQQGRTVPTSQTLIQEIKAEVGIDPEEDASLADIADFCEEQPGPQHALRRILVNRLTLCNPSNTQKVLTNQPWRSIFTTNFDDTLERCLPDGTYQIITPTSLSTNRIAGKLPLYSMHGRARDLLESSQDPRLVISERNYLNLREENRNLYAQLKNELFCANLIVIVGYSLRDLDIARILIGSGQAFRSKTVIFCGPNEGPLAVTRLGKFGHVFPIGITGLAAELERARRDGGEVGSGSYQFLEDVRPAEPASEIEGNDLVRLILTGSFSHSKYQTQLQQDKHATGLYCVRRSAALDAVLNPPEGSSNRFIVFSDIGNGKSTFLNQLTSELMAVGYRVIRISSRLNEVFSELEDALHAHKQTAILIDDVIRYRTLAEFVGARLNAYCILVCCTRSDPDDVEVRDLSGSLGGTVRHLDLNRLSSEELQSWDMALERWGFWEQRISRRSEERLEFLARECGAENRSIVLSLFRNSQIATKINQIVTFFLRTGDHGKAFAALLISSLCQQHVSWESLVSWLEIDEERLRANVRKSEIGDLFFNGRVWNIFTSTQLAEHILRTKYVDSNKDTLVAVFSTVVLRTAESANDSFLGLNFRENLKELMKFRFLTRLFGNDAAALQLINLVYKRLSVASLIRRNPQFWLQYAMSRMEVDDLQNAEAYLNTALGLAKERGKDYSPFQILDQRARLYFKKNALSLEKFSVSEIRMAISDLRSQLKNPQGEIIYLFRSVPLIYDFVEAHVDNCNEELREAILKLLLEIDASGKKYTRLPRSQKGETKQLLKAMSDTLLTLRSV